MKFSTLDTLDNSTTSIDTQQTPSYGGSMQLTTLNDLDKGTQSSGSPKAMSESKALKYAMKMGMSDSSRGLQQIYAKLTKKSSLLETLKEKDEKLRAIFENPDYGTKAFQSYLGSAIALDPIGWVPLVGWVKKSKSLADAAKYGAGLGGAYSGMSYVGEGESRLFNTVAGTTMGGVLGLGGAGVARAISKSLGREPIIPSSSDIQKKNVADRAMLTQQRKDLTPEQIEEAATQAVSNLSDNPPEIMGEGIKSFYKDVAGDKLWDIAVQNWGSGLVGVAAGTGGYNAFNDPDATQQEKIIAGVLFALGGVAGTKALAKVSTNSGTIGDIMSRGIVDNYGLSKRYTDIIQMSTGEVNSLATKFVEIVEETQVLTIAQRKALNGMITGEIDEIPELAGFSAKARNVIKEAGQQMVDAGLLSQKVFDRNADTYLKRTYEKYLRGEISKKGYNAARQIKLIGDELRSRGSKNAKTITRATYDRSLQTDSKNFGIYDDYTVVPFHTTIKKSTLEKFQVQLKKRKKEKVENYKINKTVTDVRDWKIISDDGEWVKAEHKTKIQLRRDYTKAERITMGEIEDASFNISETGRLMTNDLTTFKIYENIAKDDVLSMSKLTFEDKVARGSVESAEWIQVPKSTLNSLLKVDGKPIQRYGQLSGKYVPVEVLDDLNRIQRLKEDSDGILNGYLAINRVWKKTKTAWNPVVHVNNTVSNIILYDLADASYKYMARGFTELQKGIRKEKGAQLYNLAEEYGVFGSDMLSRELRKQSTEIGDDVLRKLADDSLPEIINAQRYSLGVFEKLAKQGYDMTAGKLERFYQLEDQAFRMGLFMDRLAKGMSPAEAAADAKKWFIDYDINAPLINAARRFPTPFLSYTYRVIPLLAEAAIKRPWKFAKWALGAHLLNEAGNTFGPGNEEEERKVMREEMQQKLFGMPFLPSTTIKLPFASERKTSAGESIPLYIDIKRFIPGGDVFTVGDKGLGIPIPFTDNRSLKLPSTLTPSFGAIGEIMIPIMTGVDPFTLQKIEGLGLENDDAVKLQHIISRLTPNIPSTAFSVPLFKAFGQEERGLELSRYDPFGETFGSKKIVKAFRQAKLGAETPYGTSFTPFESIMSAFGFKLQPIEMSKLLNIKSAEFKRFYAGTKKAVSKVQKDFSGGKIGKDEAEQQLDTLYRNLEKKVLEFEGQDEPRAQKRRGGRVGVIKAGLLSEDFPVSSVIEDPSERINELTGEPFLERNTFAVGGTVDMKAYTPLESELVTLQSQAESGLFQPDEYSGIKKKKRGLRRLGFATRGEVKQEDDTERQEGEGIAKAIETIRETFYRHQRVWEGDHGDIPVQSNDKREANKENKTYDIGYGHKIKPTEWGTGVIHGIQFKDVKTGKFIPLSEENKRIIQQQDVQQNVDVARTSRVGNKGETIPGWDAKLAARGLRWNTLDDAYKLPLEDLAYSVGGTNAGTSWTAIFDSIKDKDTPGFVGNLRRTDAGQNTVAMDNRAAKVAFQAGLITDLTEAQTFGLSLADTTEVPVRVLPTPKAPTEY